MESGERGEAEAVVVVLGGGGVLLCDVALACSFELVPVLCLGCVMQYELLVCVDMRVGVHEYPRQQRSDVRCLSQPLSVEVRPEAETDKEREEGGVRDTGSRGVKGMVRWRW